MEEREDSQKPKCKQHKQQNFLAPLKPHLENHRHREQINQKIHNNVHVRVGPPHVFVMAIRRLHQFKVPKCSERNTRRGDHGDYENVVNHDKSQERVGGATDAGEFPNANV